MYRQILCMQHFDIYVDRQKYRQKVGQKDIQIECWIERHIDRKLDRKIYRQKVGQKDIQIESWIKRYIDRKLDRKIYRQKVGYKDIQIESWIERYIDRKLDRKIPKTALFWLICNAIILCTYVYLQYGVKYWNFAILLNIMI